jgi:hypothetical protein
MRLVLASRFVTQTNRRTILFQKEVTSPMRKLVLTIAVAVVGAATLIAAPQAQAQQYPSVSGLTPFSAECNFMSKPGYLRYRYFVTSGRWISYEEAARVTAEQG